MLTPIIGIAIIILGIISAIFFSYYKGTAIPYPFAFMLLSVAVVFAAIRWMMYSSRKMLKEVTDDLNDAIAELKQNGERLPVNLSKCEVIGQTYTEQKEAYEGPSKYNIHGKPSSIDIPEGSHVLSSRSEGMTVIKEIESSESAVIYETEYRGRKRSFQSFTLHHDRVSILFKLEAQKTTSIYVDRSDPERYYFDLAFLEE